MDYKNLLISLKFKPKENSAALFFKKYKQANNYCIEVNFEKQTINYGDKIKFGKKSTQNFSKSENFVVLECVNRLLEKGYKPENIVLEKAFPLGHGGGYGDILITRNDGSTYLMIECKTYGEQFNIELKKIQKDGGQLFTYFQQDTKTELLMLYASDLIDSQIAFEYKIIKIEEEFRKAGNVKNVFKLWNKKFYEINFWKNEPYNNFKDEIFTKLQLKELTEKEGEGLFNKFAEVLRKHSVSDKPNAFTVIFNLFLAKLQDEQKTNDTELDFQWKINDDPVEFQVRLHNLHKDGLYAFLKKEVEGINDDDFNAKLTDEQKYNAKKRLLKLNKFFSIKEVLDDETFEQNHRVLKEVVQLIEKYQIRYPKKQKYLSEFFERLLTIGLKQEVGQYFTPPPITKFITRALPLPFLIEKELNNNNPELPAAIDYAAGSGHFLTEIMEEYQNIIDKIDTAKYNDIAQKKVAAWRINQYDWASSYIYGIEKDYRLVKVAKVGCYFYGDGLAQVVHGDGLDCFEKSKSYRGLLKDNANKPQFSIIVSNPPYAVNDCKDDLEYIYEQYNEKPTNFEIYNSLTYSSKEIECLFVERTKQLLKDGGVAGIVLPSSIFSNTGIYTKAREIILQYFEIIAVAELGNNTFMATGTNTVVLFLRKRNENDVEKIKTNAYNNLEHYKKTKEERVTNGVEKPMSQYLEYTKETEIDSEKFYYFVLNYWQKTVIVKTGTKEEEKRFLGYEYSNRRGHEGMHAIQRGKTIDDCTKLYNENNLEDPTKASTYIYKAFSGDYDFLIHESLKNNISCVRLVDMLTFDREKFEKIISTTGKKKVKVESRWEQILFANAIKKVEGSTEKIEKFNIKEFGKYPVITQEREKLIAGYSDNDNPITDVPIVLFGDHSCTLKYIDFDFFRGADGTVLLKPKNDFNPKYFYNVLQYFLFNLIENRDKYERHYKYLQNIKIPLPPKEIQEKIVSEIEVLEKKEAKAKEKIKNYKEKIENICIQAHSEYDKEKIIQLAVINPSKTEIADLETNTRISFVDMPSVSNDGYIVNKTDRLYSEIKKGSYTYFREGDIIIAKITPCMENGKCALATNLTNGVALGSSEFHVFRANSNKINTKYLFTLLNRKTVRIEAEKNMTGTSGHRRVPIAFYENLEVPVPPLPEQQKIVSKIEKIEAQIAGLEQQLSEIPKGKENILKKYL